MRELELRYAGECRKCGAALEAGQRGVYEKRVGVFCVPCAPTDPEEIRQYRQDAADRKADKYEEWAAKRRARADEVLNPPENHYSRDWAFITQPGRLSARERWNEKTDRAFESVKKAAEMQRKAESLRNVRVAGDKERERQAQREANDERFNKGDRVFCSIYGSGEIVRVNQKTYGVAFDRGFTQKIDKSWALAEQQSA